MKQASRRQIIAGIALSYASLVRSLSAEETQRVPRHEDAPFGLRWGMSSAEARAMGVTLDEQKNEKPNGAVFAAAGLPKMLSDLRKVILNFGFNDKLVRISAVSGLFESDPHGVGVRRRYDEVVAALEGRYGKGTPHHDRDRMYSAPDEFVAGISTGRAFYFTDFKTKDVSVQIRINGTDLSDSYYSLNYDFLPLLRQYEADRKAMEQDAL